MILSWLQIGEIFKSLFLALLFNQHHYFCVLGVPLLPDAENFDSPLKNSSPASQNFPFPPCLWKFQNFVPTQDTMIAALLDYCMTPKKKFHK